MYFVCITYVHRSLVKFKCNVRRQHCSNSLLYVISVFLSVFTYHLLSPPPVSIDNPDCHELCQKMCSTLEEGSEREKTQNSSSLRTSCSNIITAPTTVSYFQTAGCTNTDHQPVEQLSKVTVHV